MKRATYQRKLRLCGIRISHTSYAKIVLGVPPKSILLVMEPYLICPQRQRLVGRRKPVRRPISLSLALVPQQNRPLLIGCLFCHLNWQPSGAISIGLAACQSHLSRPVSCAERRRRVFHSVFLFISLFPGEKTTTTAVLFLCGTANVSRPNKREPWTILQYVLKSPI